MEDLTPGEREMRALFSDGATEASLVEAMTPKARHLPDGTFIVAGHDGDDRPVDVPITIFKRFPGLQGAMGAVFAERALTAAAGSLDTEERAIGFFLKYLEEKGLADIKPRHIRNGLLDGYRDWLDDHEKRVTSGVSKNNDTVFPTTGGGKLGVETKRAWMEHVLRALRLMQADPKYRFEVWRGVDLIRASDWQTLGTRRTPTKILNRAELGMLVRICRAEVREITARLRGAWAAMGLEGGDPDVVIEEPELMLEVARLHDMFDGRPPFKKDLGSHFKGTTHPFPRLRRLKPLEYNAALSVLYPNGRLLIPFLLLFAIYYRYNRSVVTTLNEGHFTKQASPFGERLAGDPFKNRAGRKQHASWPVGEEPDNPVEMIKTLLAWTSRIRDDADEGQAKHLFLERCTNYRTRSLAETYAFNRSFVQFLKDHEKRDGKDPRGAAARGLPRFTFKSLRPTVIDLVHHLFDGDLLITAAAGQHQVRTLMDHYLGDGARKRNAEATLVGMHVREAWWRSDGLVDGREDRRHGDLSSATPGFRCGDRYKSQIPGHKDRLCTAYGMCVSCKLGSTDPTSPKDYALLVKLREAMLRSRGRLPHEVWQARWAGALDELELTLELRFTDEAKARADLEIPPLPTVE